MVRYPVVHINYGPPFKAVGALRTRQGHSSELTRRQGRITSLHDRQNREPLPARTAHKLVADYYCTTVDQTISVIIIPPSHHEESRE